MTTKTCKWCGDAFEAKRSDKKWCSKKCARASHYTRHRERLIRENVERARANPEQAKARRDRWAQKNPEKVQESRSRYYEKNKEAIRLKNSEYRQSEIGREKRSEYDAMYRASGRAAQANARYRDSEKGKVKQRELYLAKRQERIKYAALWKKSNPEKVRASARKSQSIRHVGNLLIERVSHEVE